MRQFDPDLYTWWKKEISRQSEHNRRIEAAPILEPAKLAKRGQLIGLLAVFAVLGLAAYALYLDHPWAAGILTAIDVVALAAVFARDRGSEKE